MMKKITPFWSVLLTLLLTVSTITAQNSFTLRASYSNSSDALRAGETLSGFGYADRYVPADEIAYLGIGKVGYFLSAYIKLPDVGNNKITKISFPSKKAYEKDSYILVLSEDGKTTLYNQKCSIVKGNNEITLTTPFNTEVGKRYLVGFATKAVGNPEAGDAFVIPFDGLNDVTIEEATYLAVGTEPFPTPTSSDQTFVFISAEKFGAAYIFATLEDYSKLQNMGYLVKVAGNFYGVKKGDKVATKVSLRNIGMNDISSFDLSYQFGTGETKPLAFTPTTAIATGKTGIYSVDIPAEGEEGLGTLHFEATKVNGKASPYADRRIDIPFKIGDTDANKVKRETVLLERFTAEWCGYCPMADKPLGEFINSLRKEGFRVSYVMHHQSDGFALNESMDIASYFFPAEDGGIPAMSINRTYLSGKEMLVKHPAAYADKEWIKKLNDDKQGATIQHITQTITDNKLEVVVSGIAYKKAFDPENLFLTVILTEDNVPAINQNGGGAKYKHEALPRLFLTDAFGDKITPAADGTFSVKFTASLSTKWKKNRCKLVAFVHNDLRSKLPKARTVFTAETAYLGSDLANEQVINAKAPTVSTQDGYLHIVGDVDSFALYNMAGTLVTTSTTTRLEPGVYVIRIFSNPHIYTTKVMVP